MKNLPAALLGLALSATSGAALAEAPAEPSTSRAPAKAHSAPRRRAAKHDQARSEQVRGGRIHVMKDVIVFGRPQRPLSVLDTAAQRFDFPVGTARYSPRDRAFLPADARERW